MIETTIDVLDKEVLLIKKSGIFWNDDTKVLRRLYKKGIIDSLQYRHGLIVNQHFVNIRQALNPTLS